MLNGTIIIINDLMGTVQKVNEDNSYEVLCTDGKIRTVKGEATEVAGPHALALLIYNKTLERIKE